MKNNSAELIFIVVAITLSIGGFWNVYFGLNATPDAYHHLHMITSFTWLFLLLCQLVLISKRKFSLHRRVGYAVFFVGPLLVAYLGILTIHSANRAAAAGQADDMVVQNILPTIEVGVFILLAFFRRGNPRLHGNFLLSSALFFMAIAMTFFLISFVPQFRIDGPETFSRFETAAITSVSICMFVGLLFFLKDVRNGWPWLIFVLLMPVNMFINSMVVETGNLKSLTNVIGSLNPGYVFVLIFMGHLILLITAWKAGANLRPNSSRIVQARI